MIDFSSANLLLHPLSLWFSQSSLAAVGGEGGYNSNVHKIDRTRPKVLWATTIYANRDSISLNQREAPRIPD